MSAESTLKRAYLAMERMQRKLDSYEQAQTEPIAIVGIGCRFPGGADNPDSYWDILANGVDAVSEIPADRWDKDAFFSEKPAPGKVSTRSGGFLDRIDLFDHGFFGISRREAVFMDPQQRLALEVLWEALENAGVSPASVAGSNTGVFMGISSFDFATEQLNGPLDFTAHASTGSAHSVLSGRMSYTLDLHGPCVAIDTACSSGLVAIHQAVASLRSGECDMALSGGVNVIVSPLPSVSFSQFGRMVSVDGRCKAFDATANGYVRSEGCGIVVLKRLSDAQKAGDNIVAVVRGGAINQDGRSAGVTAPNGSAQREVLRSAVKNAGIEASAVSFVEAHGTGTRLGDPIEVEALGEVYGRDEGDPVYLGSGKTNIGHPEAAAGIAALIKVALSLQHDAIPGNVHFSSLNPDISFDGTTFQVPTELTRWPTGKSRIAGVSSFGFSGTNAHMILEQAPPVADESTVDNRRPRSVLALSAKTPASLTALAEKYRDRIVGDVSVPDFCFSANTGRAPFHHRLAVTGATNEELAEQLNDFVGGELGEGSAVGEARNSDVVFVFTGQGVQRFGMARSLYETQPTFRRVVDECAEILSPLLEKSIVDVIYEGDAESSAINETGYAQPALFAIEYALAQLWLSWGVQPVAVLGHSFGEYVASCVAGAMSLEDGLKLTVARSQLMAPLANTGAMAAISAPELVVAEEIANYPDLVAIAAVNGPTNTTISGEAKLVASICEIFTARDIRAKMLHISTASHSPLMEPILPGLREAASKIRFTPPRIPLVSNVTGLLWPWEEAPDPEYWARHARGAVRFSTGVAQLLGMGYRTFIEMSPAPVLLGLIGDMLPDDNDVQLLPSLRPKQDDWQILLGSVAEFFAAGGEFDWAGFDADYTRSRVGVPTYAFDRVQCWREPSRRTSDNLVEEAGADDLEEGEIADEDLLYRLSWQPAEATEPDTEARTWLVLTDGTGVGETVAEIAAGRGERCAVVRQDEDLAARLAELSLSDGEVLDVLHLRSLDVSAAEDPEGWLAGQQDGAMSAVTAAQALAGGPKARLWLVTRGAVKTGDGPVSVEHSTLWGIGRALAQEHSSIWGGLLDLDLAAEVPDNAAKLLTEIARTDGEDQVALHGDTRYVARLVTAESEVDSVTWRCDGSYLVTGGLGGLGLAVARSMVLAGARRLILLGRTALPPRREWAGLAEDHPAAARVAGVRELESLGASVHVEPVDVADQAQVHAFLARHDEEGLPPIRGVVHAAGVGDVVPLAELTGEQLAWHLRPKALGAWVLDKEFAGRDLDFFVLFSSTSSLLSSPYFAAYAGANAYLDALAQRRRIEGLPAVSINWGIWRDTGLAAAREDDNTPGTSRGMGTLRPAQALRVFHRLLRHGDAQVAAVPVDWADWGRRYTDASGSRLLTELVGEGRGAVPAARATKRSRTLPTREQLFALPADQRPDSLTAQLLAAVTATLDAKGTTPSADQPLFDLGVDSLMAVELKNEIEGGLGVSVPVSSFLEGASVRNLVEQIMVLLGDAGTANESGIERVERAGFDDVASELLAQLEETTAGNQS